MKINDWIRDDLPDLLWPAALIALEAMREEYDLKDSNRKSRPRCWIRIWMPMLTSSMGD